MTPEPELSLQVIFTYSISPLTTTFTWFWNTYIYTFKILQSDHLTYYYADLNYGDERKTYNNTINNITDEIYYL